MDLGSQVNTAKIRYNKNIWEGEGGDEKIDSMTRRVSIVL